MRVIQEFHHRRDRPPPVADAVLVVRRHGGKRMCGSLRAEDRIVAKAAFALGLREDGALHSAFEKVLAAVEDQADNTPETGAPMVGSFHLFQHLPYVVGKGASFTGVPG